MAILDGNKYWSECDYCGKKFTLEQSDNGEIRRVFQLDTGYCGEDAYDICKECDKDD